MSRAFQLTSACVVLAAALQCCAAQVAALLPFSVACAVDPEPSKIELDLVTTESALLIVLESPSTLSAGLTQPLVLQISPAEQAASGLVFGLGPQPYEPTIPAGGVSLGQKLSASWP